MYFKCNTSITITNKGRSAFLSGGKRLSRLTANSSVSISSIYQTAYIFPKSGRLLKIMSDGREGLHKTPQESNETNINHDIRCPLLGSNWSTDLILIGLNLQTAHSEFWCHPIFFSHLVNMKFNLRNGSKNYIFWRYVTSYLTVGKLHYCVYIKQQDGKNSCDWTLFSVRCSTCFGLY